MTSVSLTRRYGLNSQAAVKVPVKAASTAALTLSGEQTVDGVSCVTDDRVLVKNQSDQTTNGVFVVDTGSWTRDIDFDDSWDVVTGTIISVLPGGTANGSTYWYLTTTGTIGIGTSNLTFAQINMLSYSEPAEQTVASAATGADIWTAEGVVSWTGTATTTAFGAATRAGQRRTLICVGACSFTAGANLLIRGVPSGGTITMAANDLVHVLALTTTQFQLDFDKSDALPTVASHATTGDIWSKGNTISWTGTATTTAFPNAPTAGAQRTLICAGACLFTDGANLIIEGVVSGTTVTMKANAIVRVVALTTSQFKLTYSLTGTVIVTTAGFSSEATPTVTYTVVNGLATIYVPQITNRTSDDTILTLSTLPAEIRPSYAVSFSPPFAHNNSADIYTTVGSIGTNGVITFTPTIGGAWTGSNNKGLYAFTHTYML